MNSQLQIISGKFKGRKLRLPAGARPTQNRARIALFNMLNEIRTMNHEPRTTTVWDAFAGSGALGLECLSRDWADKVIFTDTSQESLKALEVNSIDFDNVIAARANAISEIERIASTTDLVFVDPPYEAHDIGQRFINAFFKTAKPGAIAVWEIDAKNAVEIPPNAEVLRDKAYGRARFLILKFSI